MLKITTWRPDTCDCVIEYTWDDEVPQNEIVQTIHKITEACQHHQGIVVQADHFDQVLKENQGKNIALSVALDNFPQLAEDKILADGSVNKVLAAGVNYDYSFDKNRNLIVSFTGKESLSVNEKTDLQTLLDDNPKFEAGEVKVN